MSAYLTLRPQSAAHFGEMLVLVITEHYAAAPRCGPTPRAKALVVVVVVIHLCMHDAFEVRMSTLCVLSKVACAKALVMTTTVVHL